MNCGRLEPQGLPHRSGEILGARLVARRPAPPLQPAASELQGSRGRQDHDLRVPSLRSEPRLVAAVPGVLQIPRWSPDGRKVAYQVYKGPDWKGRAHPPPRHRLRRGEDPNPPRPPLPRRDSLLAPRQQLALPEHPRRLVRDLPNERRRLGTTVRLAVGEGDAGTLTAAVNSAAGDSLRREKFPPACDPRVARPTMQATREARGKSLR